MFIQFLILAFGFVLLIGGANLLINGASNIAKKFNKSNGMAVLSGIFSFIFILIFGYSKNEVYDKNISVSKNGIFK